MDRGSREVCEELGSVGAHFKTSYWLKRKAQLRQKQAMELQSALSQEES